MTRSRRTAGAHLIVELAGESDVTSWLELAAEVGDLFGADMASDPRFRDALRGNVARGTAFCIKIDGAVAGAMLFSAGTIGWLAVSKRHRRRGIARALIAHPQATGCDVRVTTFGRAHPHPDSQAARALYGELGFVTATEAAAPGPDGTPREQLVWSRSSRANAATRAPIAWLLASDPAIRWQVMRDLVSAPAQEVERERTRVGRDGIGAQLLASQATDGRWAGAAWNRGWTSTMHALMLLRDLGLDPASEPARRALGLVREHVTWRGCGPSECDANAFFAGELEPCINGQVAAVGAYFGQDVSGLVTRLLAEQLSDGGWNCDAANGSTRASFHTTLCVLEALLEYELSTGGNAQLTAARLRGQEYLVERRLYRRRSTGEVIQDRKAPNASWTRFAFPTWWHYDVLRALDYLRRAGAAPDPRMAEAIALLESKRDGDGRWPLDARYPGPMLVDLDEREGQPSRWITLRALRVLHWYSAGNHDVVR